MENRRLLIPPELRIYPDANQEWRWSIKVGLDIIAASTEGYKNREDCVNNILNVEQRIKYLREKGEIK